MSNQFPPSGFDGRHAENQNRDGQQVFGGNDYNSYGSYGRDGAGGNDYNSYSGGDQYASQGDQYATQGDQYASQGDGYASQGDQQQVYGAGQPQYGQQQQYGDAQHQYQPQAAAAYGNYNGNQGGGPGGAAPKKKGVPVWAWIVIGVVAVALVGGGIWGGIALFGGGNSSQTTANGGSSMTKPTPGQDFHLTVTGSQGSIHVPQFILPHEDDRLILGRSDGAETVEHLGPRSSYTYQLEALTDAVRHGAALLTDADFAVEVMDLIDAAYRTVGLDPRTSTAL